MVVWNSVFVSFTFLCFGLTWCRRRHGVKYVSTARTTSSRAKYFSYVSEILPCAVNCSIMTHCAYFEYTVKGHVCKHYYSRNSVFMSSPGTLRQTLWRVDCGKPPRASHGRVTVADRTAGYTCNTHFKMMGNETLTCVTSWPKAPKCHRIYWTTPRVRKKVYNFNIPWGFSSNGTVTLTGRPTGKNENFTVIIGTKKSGSKKLGEPFLVYMRVASVSDDQQNIVIVTEQEKSTKRGHYFPSNRTSTLEITMGQGKFRISVNREQVKEFPIPADHVRMIDIRYISLLNYFHIETLSVTV